MNFYFRSPKNNMFHKKIIKKPYNYIELVICALPFHCLMDAQEHHIINTFLQLNCKQSKQDNNASDNL